MDGDRLCSGDDRRSGGTVGNGVRFRSLVDLCLENIAVPGRSIHRDHPLLPSYDADDIGRHIFARLFRNRRQGRSEEHTSALQSLMRISYAVLFFKKKKLPILYYCVSTLIIILTTTII